MEDIARVSRLSKMTVSRVFSTKGSVSEKARKKVLAAVDLLDYEFNYIGRQLNSNRTGMMGVITLFDGLVGTNYFERILQGLQQALLKADYHITLYDSLSEDFNDGTKCAKLCRQKRVDGLVVVAPHKDSRFVKTFSDLDVPLIVVGSSPRHKTISYVDVDNFGGASAATEHLIRLGHRRIGFIRGLSYLNDADERELAFRKTMAKSGIAVRKKWILQGAYETHKAFHTAFKLLSTKDRPTAIFAANDLSAFGVIDAARSAGLKVPEDLSVIGFDDIKSAETMMPPLTTVRQPLQQLGKTAAEYLLERVSNSQNQNHHVLRRKLPFELIIRSSTAVPPKGNENR